MSKYDKEREAMGLKPLASSASAAAPGVSKYAAEREYYNNPEAYNARGAAEMDESRQVNMSREPAPAPKPDVETRARQLPVIGPVLRGLDAFATNPVVDKVASLARSFYVPGAGLANVAGLTEAAGTAVGRALPTLGASAGGRIAKSALTEGLSGAPIGVGQELMVNPDARAGDLARGAALGGAFGAGFGGGLTGLAEGASRVAGSAANSLARNAFEQAAQTAPALRRVESPSKIRAASSPNIPEPPASLSGLLQEMRNAPTEAPTASQGFKRSDSANLQELLSAKGLPDDSAESIASAYNGKNWYHGTGTDSLTAEMLDPFAGSHESLFGQGVYLTDSPPIAKGYANSRGGRRGSTPTIYETGVNMNRVLDLEKPITSDVVDAIDQSVKSLDYVYQQELGKPDYFTNFVKEQAAKPGATSESVIQSLRKEVESFSHEAEIPTSEFVENFQDLAINLKQAGYDGLTHTGGGRTGNEAHRVLILLDPQNAYGAGGNAGSQISRFSKYTGPTESFSGDVPAAAPKGNGNGQAPEFFIPSSIRKAPRGVSDDVAESKYAAEREQIKQEQADATTASENPSVQQVDTSALAAKGDMMTRLFGDQQGLGFSPFGSKTSKRMVSTEQQIVNNPLKSTIEGLKENIKHTGRTAYQNAVDFLAPLKKISTEVYNAAMDASRAKNIANTIIRDKFVDLEGNVIGSSLNDVMAASRGLGKKVDDYLVLRHAIDRMARGERVYDDALAMTPEKAAQAVAKLEARYPQLKQIGEEWNSFNDNLLESGVREGLITQEAKDAMREKNPNYASMRRQFTTAEKFARPAFGTGGSGFSGQKAPIKQVSPTGSTRKIVSPLRSAVEQTYAWKQAELRNRTMQEIVKAIQRDPEGMQGIAEVVKKPNTSYRSLDEALREGGSEEFLDALDNDFKSLFQHAKPGEDNIVRAMVKGTPIYVRVNDPEAVKALLGMGSEQSNIIMHVMQKLSNATKRSATGLFAPMFSIKSLFGDTAQAAMQSKSAVKHLTVDLPHAVISSLADVLRIPGLKDLAEEFRRAGGEYSALLRGDRAVNKSVRGLRREAPFTPRGVAKGAEMLVKAPFKALEKVADISENVNRMAAYRRSILDKERTPGNVRAAINAARESTTNFSRRGAWANNAEAFVPYSNAANQSLYRLAKTFRDHPVKSIAAVSSLVIAPKLYEYARFKDDPDYQNLPARERYRNLIVGKNSDGSFTKIPMPTEYESVGAFMTDVLDRVVRNDPEAFKGTLDALANAYTPPLVSGALQGVTQKGGAEQSLTGTLGSSVFAPFVSIVANKSFTGAPIVSKSVEGLSPQYQYTEKTSEPAKQIGKLINMSPMKVDYLLRNYSGDIGRLVVPLTSESGAGTARNTLLKNFIVDPAFTNNLTNDYYDGIEKLNQAYKDYTERGVQLPTWYNDTLRKQLTTTARGSASQQLSDLNKLKTQINKDGSLSAQQKADKLRDVQVKMNAIYSNAAVYLRKSGVPLQSR